ncbi:hypothetical protein [Rhizobium alvei]|uniref:Uncharacterized protein n=1 Tax=Rhizobium alvei TaxID=1132659 RepID=A0ABT8YL64_9HYPH|nr:hypothetical protein [Rhizobium alvei]MDO6964044.1 hypothetical protein [Rhizobium alvei]
MTTDAAKAKDVSISLTRAEALVLFEMLSRYSDSTQDRVLVIEDAAERQALWNFCSTFEKVLAEPFLANWPDVLADAKQALTYEDGQPFDA